MNGKWNGRRVMLVEDDDSIRGAFGILLEDGGYDYREAATGREALEIAAEHKPELILMDLGLPDRDGLEVTRAIKADPETRSAIVIALTGRAMPEDQIACMEAGCAECLVKPIGAKKLLATVAEWLQP